VLADVGDDQLPVGLIEGEAVGVAEAVGVDLGHLAGGLGGIVGGDAVLAVGAGRVGAAGGEGGVERVDAQHLAQGDAQVLRVAAGLDVAGADVVGVAAV